MPPQLVPASPIPTPRFIELTHGARSVFLNVDAIYTIEPSTAKERVHQGGNLYTTESRNRVIIRTIANGRCLVVGDYQAVASAIANADVASPPHLELDDEDDGGSLSSASR